MKPCCANCVWATFERSASGKTISRKWAGRCGFEPVFPALPDSLKVTRSRNAIWADDGQNCPTYQSHQEPLAMGD